MSLEQLKARIAKAQGKDKEAPTGPAPNASMAFRVAVELGASAGVSAFLGFWLDKWLGTAPVLLLIFLLLGIMAGFLSIYRLANPQKTDKKTPPNQPS